jgi:drug/metabolite transporter (DMT)-like permease
MSEPRSKYSPRLILAAIMLALLAWAGYIAAGSYWVARENNSNPWRGVIVLLSMAVFLGFWLLALWVQSRRGPRSRP